MELPFDKHTLLPKELPADVPDWAKTFLEGGLITDNVRDLYDLALMRRQQQLLRHVIDQLEKKGAPHWVTLHLTILADTIGELVEPYLNMLDQLGQERGLEGTEDIEPAWLPDFTGLLPLHWQV